MRLQLMRSSILVSLLTPLSSNATEFGNSFPIIDSISVTHYEVVRQWRLWRLEFSVANAEIVNTGSTAMKVKGVASRGYPKVAPGVLYLGNVDSGSVHSQRVIVISKDSSPTAFAQINWTFRGIQDDGLPPDPGGAANQSLLGVDSDSDGLRDDLERQFAVDFAHSPARRNAALQSIAAMRTAIISRDNHGAALAAVPEIVRAVDCLFAIDPDNAGATINRVENAYTNTIERLQAYVDFHETLGQLYLTVEDLPLIQMELCDAFQ